MEKHYRYEDIINALHDYVRMAINEEGVEIRTEVVTQVIRILDTVPPVEDPTADELKRLWKNELKERNRLQVENMELHAQLEDKTAEYSNLYNMLLDIGVRTAVDEDGYLTLALPYPPRRRLFSRKGR